MRRAVALDDLRDFEAPPVRVRDVAALSGFSKAKIMADAKAGELALTWVTCGQRRMALVSRHEAYRYLHQMGIAA